MWAECGSNLVWAESGLTSVTFACMHASCAGEIFWLVFCHVGNTLTVCVFVVQFLILGGKCYAEFTYFGFRVNHCATEYAVAVDMLLWWWWFRLFIDALSGQTATSTPWQTTFVSYYPVGHVYLQEVGPVSPV